MDARNVVEKIIINGEDVTQDISPYVESIRYEDVLSGQTDSLTLELSDRDKLFIKDWLPERGFTLHVTLTKKNWEGENKSEELDLGTYEIDELEYGMPPRVMKLKACSCPQNSALRQVDQSRSWENVKLSKIAKDIAEAAQVELFYQTDEDPEIKRVEQGEKSALNFLDEQCRKYYLALKFADNKIIIFDESELDKAEPAFTLKEEHSILKKINAKLTLTNVYRSCQVNYSHGKKAEEFKAEFVDESKTDGKILKVNKKVESQAEAEKLARNSLRDKNKKERQLTLTCTGDFRLLAGNVFKLEGFDELDKYKWLIERATHTVDKGYSVRVDARSCLSY